MYVVLVLILLFLLARERYLERFVGIQNFGLILPQKNLVVRRTTRPQFLVVLTYFLVADDARTLEFCYPELSWCHVRPDFHFCTKKKSLEMQSGS